VGQRYGIYGSRGQCRRTVFNNWVPASYAQSESSTDHKKNTYHRFGIPKKYGMPEEVVKVVERMYTDSKVHVQVGKEN
jgi:hypothetical protein